MNRFVPITHVMIRTFYYCKYICGGLYPWLIRRTMMLIRSCCSCKGLKLFFVDNVKVYNTFYWDQTEDKNKVDFLTFWRPFEDQIPYHLWIELESCLKLLVSISIWSSIRKNFKIEPNWHKDRNSIHPRHYKKLIYISFEELEEIEIWYHTRRKKVMTSKFKTLLTLCNLSRIIFWIVEN